MTSHLVLSLYYRSYLHQIRNVSAKVCEVDIVGEECEVKMVGEECEVVRGVGVGENVDCSAECDTECTMVISGGEI